MEKALQAPRLERSELLALPDQFPGLYGVDRTHIFTELLDTYPGWGIKIVDFYGTGSSYKIVDYASHGVSLEELGDPDFRLPRTHFIGDYMPAVMEVLSSAGDVTDNVMFIQMDDNTIGVFLDSLMHTTLSELLQPQFVMPAFEDAAEDLEVRDLSRLNSQFIYTGPQHEGDQYPKTVLFQCNGPDARFVDGEPHYCYVRHAIELEEGASMPTAIVESLRPVNNSYYQAIIDVFDQYGQTVCFEPAPYYYVQRACIGARVYAVATESMSLS